MDAEDDLVVLQEDGKHGRRDVERGREDDADVAHRHLVDVRVVDDLDQERNQILEQRRVGLREALDELGQRSHLLLLVRHLHDGDELRTQVVGQDGARKLAEVQLEQ